MSWFHRQNIAVKLLLSFLTVLLLTTGLGVFSLVQMDRVNQSATEASVKWLPAIRTVITLEKALARVRSTEFQHMLADAAGKASLEKALQERYAEFDQLQSEFEALDLTPEERATFAQLRRTLAAFLAENRKIIALSREGHTDEALALTRGESLKAYRAVDGHFAALRKASVEGGDAADRRADAVYDASRGWILALLAASIAIGTLLAVFIARAVSRPLTEAAHLARRVADSDLTAQVHLRAGGEVGQLLRALDEMTGSLSRVVGDVRGSVGVISGAAREIANGNADLSSRTESQASSLQQTAASIEQLTATVRQNADNARQANQLVGQASAHAQQGGAVVGQVVSTMGAIQGSSRRIADITGVIDSIAFQTNILALNAAVEAARAGEQGRGFAVVAAEVRSLAQRSASAAKEIKELIADSSLKVDGGVALVEQAGATMEDIVASVRQVAEIMSGITAASQEQRTGIEEVNRAVTEMDAITQQNAALVEEAAAATQSLQQQAQALERAVQVFRLRDGGARPGPTASLAPMAPRALLA
ncbi:methyl-accepting chemotaxis protein [Paracidovorax anthurii]|uniref:Methyl-accepting chemotaxis protein n=1 Tax=Paracidovorax anthurii TaxID=78229 RepID=A0A328Z1S7_9BURK|nr:methyl-accepting chemotaxis protein [Paracidovorax anthurii]RAR76196.1 methyl-accepting chemotaxis protein [Paracidovorax anthurii]